MNAQSRHMSATPWPKLEFFPLPAKILVTSIIMTLAIAMLGALAQVVVHDIIPTFQEMRSSSEPDSGADQQTERAVGEGSYSDSTDRGDLFSEEAVTENPGIKQAFYKSEQFVWSLKWTHIHLFGMNMIFVFMGAITLFLDLPNRTRAWLVGLPFAGVLVDIAAMWLKGYVSPHFFWLHIPGGGVFGIIFAYVSIRALVEMWRRNPTAQ